MTKIEVVKKKLKIVMTNDKVFKKNKTKVRQKSRLLRKIEDSYDKNQGYLE